jgi:hypothetical protein
MSSFRAYLDRQLERIFTLLAKGTLERRRGR